MFISFFRCIVASLSDPNTFLLDHLLQLKPVKFLEGELIHDLLKIFVSEKLEAYQKFYENHREFVNNLGLTHEDNIKKMKLLTFMQLAETKSEIRFGEIQQHMQISEAEVEEFLIDVLKTKLVRAKIDQGNQVRFIVFLCCDDIIEKQNNSTFIYGKIVVNRWTISCHIMA